MLSSSLVILNPSLVILSEAKNLLFEPLRINSAKHLLLLECGESGHTGPLEWLAGTTHY